MATPNIIGKSCGEFTVEKHIGKGTFGQVYLVTRTDQIPSRTGSFQPTNYAMKVINLSRANGREKELLDRETQILSDLKRFKHQNIVEYVECFRQGDSAYIIMEYCERGTLYEYIRQNKVVSEYMFVEFVRQMASGLEFLHSKNVLHRDVKSKNILLTAHNDVKIADFGVAREIPVAAPGNMSVFIGSPQYMSPEMLAKKPYDEKTDIWSLGCTCFEMGTGDYAFKAENIQQIRQLVEKKQLPPMENADYCDDIKSIIMWMLQKESANRPTAKQVQEAISSHKCKNIGTHTAVELSKAVAKVAPRKKERKTSETKTNESVMGATMKEVSNTQNQQDYLQKQSNKYQAQIVRLMGGNRASEHVTKIIKVCRKHSTDYDKIKTVVRKYIREDRYERVYPLVLALKGVEEAISSQNQSPLHGDSDT
ncbi:serine/threonine-protein kinase Nek4-like isoform X2 [Mytilus galloprovincialis]|uniref:serine/threonine-protein kinase Nek4-like isoform X2 n=1 Tax=Mytilus galloprovincialis TaxID=29158 RepID=UPI003F7C7791